ncbi:DNA mismatch repair protein MutS [Streptomyces sp. GMY01]|uniref:MutS-related protein n=1 Tax=Streptomyces sp. GMY02 TaxID=1333528 RepID=UPI00146B64CE|nr:DNA mismatch repair protein MutS [Streptomyces sp. GMY02]NMO33451.1 DNA mismatch repair protein MutS [Streptomyces sp. GMY02]
MAGPAQPAPSTPSVLFPDGCARPDESSPEPDYFSDLNLDQFVDAVDSRRSAYRLASFFRGRLHDARAIEYRQAVFRDLADLPELTARIDAFGERMRDVRDRLRGTDAMRHRYQEAGWLLEAVHAYTGACTALAEDLTQYESRARALQAIAAYVRSYVASDAFAALAHDAERLQERLDDIRYCLLITPGRVKVGPYEGQGDYGAEILADFEKFRQGETKSHRFRFASDDVMNHVEEAILDRVALLYPDVFEELTAFRHRHADFLDPGLAAFDREIQFYLAYRAYIAPLERAGLPFCLPEVLEGGKGDREVAARDVFDLVLADKLVAEGDQVVLNDFRLSGPERFLVVSGPNQGGKTTFARAFGQLHHLAALGCPVPCRQARLLLCDGLFTHFEHGENLTDLSGKLHDDLVRVRTILERATPAGVVVLNEVFTSTTLDDAVLLGARTLEQLIERGLIGVCVTFVDELSTLGEATASMVAAVDSRAVPTFHIERRAADGLSYAVAVAERHGLTYERLRERIRP